MTSKWPVQLFRFSIRHRLKAITSSMLLVACVYVPDGVLLFFYERNYARLLFTLLINESWPASFLQSSLEPRTDANMGSSQYDLIYNEDTSFGNISQCLMPAN